jgi:hypothetical protein
VTETVTSDTPSATAGLPVITNVLAVSATSTGSDTRATNWAEEPNSENPWTADTDTDTSPAAVPAGGLAVNRPVTGSTVTQAGPDTEYP